MVSLPSRWDVADVTLISFNQDEGQKGPKETGLYRIRGVTVEALLGAIYHQHGAQMAMGFFAAKILPTLNTFTEEEAQALKSAIESDAEGGEEILRGQSARTTQPINRAERRQETLTEEVKEASTGASEEEDLVKRFSEQASSKPTSARRRTTTSSTSTTTNKSIALEEETSNSRPSEGRSIV
jgi:hypothetical protein